MLILRVLRGCFSSMLAKSAENRQNAHPQASPNFTSYLHRGGSKTVHSLCVLLNDSWNISTSHSTSTSSAFDAHGCVCQLDILKKMVVVAAAILQLTLYINYLPTGTVSLCLAVDSAYTAVGFSTMPARQSGTRCLMNLEILTVLIVLNGSWKQ